LQSSIDNCMHATLSPLTLDSAATLPLLAMLDSDRSV